MNLLKIIKWAAVQTACLTMVFSPVAYGLEAEKLSKAQLSAYVQEFGLDQKTTLGEFWQKSKAYYPGHMYKEIEAFVQQNKNVEMPQVEVSSSKSTDGAEVPVLQLTQNGKTNRIQFFSEKQKWAKIDNTTLSAADLERPDDVYKRMVANDIKVKNQYDKLITQSQGQEKVLTADQLIQEKDLARFTGFPRVNPVMWKSLSLEQRASYIIKMRFMYMSAQKVLETEDSKPSAKNFIELLIGGHDAFAQKKSKPAVKLAENCIVAGYIGAEDYRVDDKGIRRKVCSLDKAQSLYDGATPPNHVRYANIECINQGNNFRACNPIQYGFPNGKPICVDQNKASFQSATHRDNACDSASPLSSAKLVMNFNGKDYSNVMPPSKRQKLIEDDQRASEFKYSKDFINGILLHKDSLKSGGDTTIADMFTKGIWSAELDKELVSIQQAYENEINKAIDSCHKNIALKQVDKNQKGACDQLHRRWLFTEKFVADLRSKACPDPSKYVGAYDDKEAITGSAKTEMNKKQLADSDGSGMCKCPEGEVISFKGQCKSKSVVVVPPVTKEKTPAEVVDKSCPLGTIGFKAGKTEADNKCACEENKDKLIPQSTSPADVKKLCAKSNLWKWIFGGALALIVIGIASRHKNRDKASTQSTAPVCAGNKKLMGADCVCKTSCGAGQTQNPESCGCSVNPAPQSCTPPMVGMAPNCACPASNTCTPGQQIYNQMTCQCDNVVQPVTCPNGTPAPNNNLTHCPKCDDGSYKTTMACPGEGGTGENCPLGNCNGGAPPAVKTQK